MVNHFQIGCQYQELKKENKISFLRNNTKIKHARRHHIYKRPHTKPNLKCIGYGQTKEKPLRQQKGLLPSTGSCNDFVGLC